jgi:FkbM family methyltransferase
MDDVIQILLNTKGVWKKTPHERARMTTLCRDTDYIPKVKNAGNIEIHAGKEVQIMHNGLVVLKNGYQGRWQAEVIQDLKGTHEPQEEKVFFEVLQRIDPGGVIMELGAWWAYYSLWFLKQIPQSMAICCEPDENNLKIGQQNAKLNKISEERIRFYQSAAGSKDSRPVDFINTEGTGAKARVPIRSVDSLIKENSLDRLEILHLDIQGHELEALHGALQSIKQRKLRFVFISTHHYSISQDLNIHQKCKDFILDNGGHMIAEHTISESCSGDGLIVSSFDARDKEFNVSVSHVPSKNSLFRSPEDDLLIIANEFGKLKKRLEGAYSDIDKLTQEIEKLRTRNSQLGEEINQITPLRKHIKRQVKRRIQRPGESE